MKDTVLLQKLFHCAVWHQRFFEVIDFDIPRVPEQALIFIQIPVEPRTVFAADVVDCVVGVLLFIESDTTVSFDATSHGRIRNGKTVLDGGVFRDVDSRSRVEFERRSRVTDRERRKIADSNRTHVEDVSFGVDGRAGGDEGRSVLDEVAHLGECNANDVEQINIRCGDTRTGNSVVELSDQNIVPSSPQLFRRVLIVASS